jgi:alkylation response protein AidB-like acyl-CoA dehydrogenase
MYDALLTQDQRELRDGVRAFVRDDVPRQLILDMDARKVSYPRELLEATGRRAILG